jgi:hypothetical protein
MKTILTVVAGILMVAGCSKYENGPDFSLKSKKERISNNWTVNEAIRLSGDGETFQSAYDDYQLNIGEDEKYTKFYRMSADEHCIEQGRWNFTNDKMHLVTTCDNGKETDYLILRLALNELWVRFTDAGSEWELHLRPKATY